MSRALFSTRHCQGKDLESSPVTLRDIQVFYQFVTALSDKGPSDTLQNSHMSL
jgi:hypothetical protein